MTLRTEITERVLLRAVAWLVRLHLADSRALLAPEMTGMFADDLRRVRAERGRSAMLRFALGVLLSVVVTGVQARLRTVFAQQESPPTEATLRALLNETRQSLRALRGRPGYAAVTLLTFVMAIDGATSVFSVLRHVMLEPLPFPHAPRLVHLWETNRGDLERNFSIPNFESVRAGADSLDAVAAYMFGDFPSVTLTGGDRPERIAGAYVTPGMFGLVGLLGVEPARGRAFAPEEAEPDVGGVVILSHDLWANRFAANPDILGQSLPLSGRDHVVVGVMPPGFDFPVGSGARLWRPLPYFDAWKDNRGNHLLRVVGRASPGIDLGAVDRELADLGAVFAAEFPDANAEGGMRAVPLHDQLIGGLWPAAYALTAAVALFWLIAAANLANLGVARLLDRMPELTVRRAHGATRIQVARVLAVENAVLATAGTAIGVIAARAGVTILAATGPATIPRLSSVSFDTGALLFALGLATLTALGSGVPLALVSFGTTDASSLVTGHRGATHGRRGRALRSGLVVVELALALVLVVGSTLLLQSLGNLMRVDPGFQTERILTAEVALPAARYQEAAMRRSFYAQLLPELERIAGVQAATAVNVFPLTGNPGGSTSLHRRGATETQGLVPGVRFRVAMPDYFATIGLPVLTGRTFNEADDEGPAVAVINQALASQLWGDTDPTVPTGRTIFGGTPDNPGRTYEVVGLVGDVRAASLDRDPRPHIFIPYSQFAMQEMVLGAADDRRTRTAGPRGAERRPAGGSGPAARGYRQRR